MKNRMNNDRLLKITMELLENNVDNVIKDEYGDEICKISPRTIKNAIALLKEQDGKPMIENERGWNCPSCGMNLIGKTASGYPCDLIDLPEDEPIHFCPMCGQAVIWE